MSSIIQAAIAVPLTILAIGLFVHFIEKQPKRRARREAAFAYEELLNKIKFCSHIAYIYDLQDEVLDYTNEWKRVIDFETLDQFTGALYKALTEKQGSLQKERNQAYNKRAIYN